MNRHCLCFIIISKDSIVFINSLSHAFFIRRLSNFQFGCIFYVFLRTISILLNHSKFEEFPIGSFAKYLLEINICYIFICFISCFFSLTSLFMIIGPADPSKDFALIEHGSAHSYLDSVSQSMVHISQFLFWGQRLQIPGIFKAFSKFSLFHIL